MMPQSDHELDVRGLQCPLPVLKAFTDPVTGGPEAYTDDTLSLRRGR
jgi:hypothetical protein